MSFDLARAVQAFVTLIVIMDPLGNVPVFVALTASHDRAQQRRTAIQATLGAALLIYAFAFFGTGILASLSIGLPALKIAGGVMLFLTALEMLRGQLGVADAAAGANIAIVPLATPLLAGPGAIAAVMVLMTGGGAGTIQLANQLPVVVGIAATLAVSFLALFNAHWLERLLKDNGIHLVTRVMGMLLLAIAVELVASGVMDYA